MGECVFCNEKAGLFRKEHKECRQLFESGKRKIASMVEKSLNDHQWLKDNESQLKEIAIQNFIDKKTLTKVIINGWENAVDMAFEDGILTEEEEVGLVNISSQFSLSQFDLDENGYYTKIVKGAILRDILEGKVPDRININGNLPFNFQKSEKMIWLFRNVDYFEQKTKRTYVGGSQGFSVRIAKGLYYRVGSFKGERVDTQETAFVDTGMLGVTNKHIYFAGENKSFRVRHDKIVSFNSYSDGIGIQKDGVSAKPQMFVTGDGWFVYNLLSNVSNL